MKKYYREFEIIVFVLLLVITSSNCIMQLYIQNQNKRILYNQELMLIQLNAINRKVNILFTSSIRERLENLKLRKQFKEKIEPSKP